MGSGQRPDSLYIELTIKLQQQLREMVIGTEMESRSGPVLVGPACSWEL